MTRLRRDLLGCLLLLGITGLGTLLIVGLGVWWGPLHTHPSAQTAHVQQHLVHQDGG